MTMYVPDKVLRDRIRIFLDSTSGLTGLQFLEMPNPPDDDKTRWVFFLNRRGVLGCADQSIKNFTNEGVQVHIKLRLLLLMDLEGDP